MEQRPTLTQLVSRWNRTLEATGSAVMTHPTAYRDLKRQLRKTIAGRIDINDYFSTVERFTDLLEKLDPGGRDTIFHYFRSRIAPTSIWDVKLLRMECRDLMNHLEVFDQWRRERHHLRVVK
jgi:hypothetical protein